MTITQRRLVIDTQGRQREAVWDVDLAVLGATQRWAQDRARAERELHAMAEMYPAWTLVLGQSTQAVERPGCADVAVPTGGAWRWASDGAVVVQPERPGVLGKLAAALRTRTQGNWETLWQGLLPAPLSGLKRVAEKLRGHYPVDEIAGRPWTAAPLRVCYPCDFPQTEPAVFYEAEWLRTLGVHSGGGLHILGGHRLCLFYPGHWKRPYTVADVLSRRVINHMYSILKHAAGANAQEAFIGRIHDEAWGPGQQPQTRRSDYHDR